jgi:AcrR family transcriptional regulator
VQREPVKPPGAALRGRGKSDRWAAHRARRRAELIEAAVEAVREHGAGVSVAAIAAAAGVTKPVLYRHFADRADLQRAVSERGAAMLTARLVPELTTEREPVERISAIVDAFLATAEEEPELWRFVVHNPGDREAGNEVVAHSIALIAGLLTSALVDALRERGRDAGGAEAWAYGLAGMVYTAGDWWLQRRTLTRAALTDYLTSMIWGGLSGVLGVLGHAESGAAGGDRTAAPPAVPLRAVAGGAPGSGARREGAPGGGAGDPDPAG